MSFITSIGQKAVFVLDNVFSKKRYTCWCTRETIKQYT